MTMRGVKWFCVDSVGLFGRWFLGLGQRQRGPVEQWMRVIRQRWALSTRQPA